MQQFILKNILSLFLLTVVMATMGQNTGNRIITGPEGAVIQLTGLDGSNAGGKISFPSPGTTIDINKYVNGKSRKLATVSFPRTAKEMEQRLGEELTSSLIQNLKLRSAEEAYATLLREGPKKLGFLAFLRPVMEAFGLVYVDKSWNKEQQASYSFQLNTSSGKREIAERVNAAHTQMSYDSTIRFKLSRYSVSDSSITSLWSAKLVSNPCYFAQPMRSEGNSNVFRPTAQQTMVFQEKDSIYIQYNELITPGSRIKYFVHPTDWAGNAGLPSDTLYILAVNTNQLTGITGLTVKDTLEGLLLQWDPLPAEAVYTGIQILKSRQVGSDYIIVDTVSAGSTSYLDRQILPNVNYFYKLAPIFFRLPGRDMPAFAEANGAMLKDIANNIPQKPMGLRAGIADGKIKLQWDASPDLNLFGYYVLRGTSVADLTVISGVVKAHEYWDTVFSSNYSGEYLYAVKAVNQNQQTSELSAISSVSVRQPVILPAPGGIIARRQDNAVYLEWDHSYFGNNGITGYFLYTRKPGENSFRVLTTVPMREPFYIDSTAGIQAMEYAVTCTDPWGNQSILSPVATVAANLSSTIAPPISVKLGNRAEGIAVSWPVPYEKGYYKYCIYRKSTTEKDFRKLATVDPSEYYIDKTAEKDKLYEYAISVIAEGKTESARSSSSSVRRR